MPIASAPSRNPTLLRDDPSRSRPRELEDGLNLYLYHPLAARLARLLKPTGISPNAVSIFGCVLVWAAAWAYTGLAWPQGVVVGFTLHILWHVADGADGDLARLTGKSSPSGELVDGVCDLAGHIVLYVALAAMLQNQIGGWAWPLAVAAGASHIAQSTHAETQRRSYLWWAYGVPWLKHAQAAGDAMFRRQNWFSITYAWMAPTYVWLANALNPFSDRVDAAVDAAAHDSPRTAAIRRLVRRASRRSLRFQKVVGPNPRTIILGASMALGSPLYYFLAETVLLNLALVLSVRHHNVVGRLLAERLERTGND
jgi:hypothetical protein